MIAYLYGIALTGPNNGLQIESLSHRKELKALGIPVHVLSCKKRGGDVSTKCAHQLIVHHFWSMIQDRCDIDMYKDKVQKECRCNR